MKLDGVFNPEVISISITGVNRRLIVNVANNDQIASSHQAY